MCVHERRLRAIKAAGRLYGADHDWHPCLEGIMRRFRYSLEEALEFIAECRAEMRRLGRKPESRCICQLNGPFQY
jgi:hypothetical protein